MSDDPADSKHSQSASKQLRDEFGHFVKTQEDQDGENLVDVKVHNPFKKIYAILESIKKKQETTLAFKATIPLIAIPVILSVLFGLGGFQLGRLNPVCQPQFTTRVGTLYVLTLTKPADKNLVQSLLPFLYSQPAPTPTIQAVLKDGNEVYQLSLSFPLSSLLFHGKEVAVSGNLNPCTQNLSITASENITTLMQ